MIDLSASLNPRKDMRLFASTFTELIGKCLLKNLNLPRFVALVLLMMIAAANAQSPPIRLIVGVPPGTELDAQARRFASAVSRTGQTLVVDNRPSLAEEIVGVSKPNGQVLLFASMAPVRLQTTLVQVFETSDGARIFALLGTPEHIIQSLAQLFARATTEATSVAPSANPGGAGRADDPKVLGRGARPRQ